VWQGYHLDREWSTSGAGGGGASQCGSCADGRRMPSEEDVERILRKKKKTWKLIVTCYGDLF
jgi:hypothetical protein